MLNVYLRPLDAELGDEPPALNTPGAVKVIGCKVA